MERKLDDSSNLQILPRQNYLLYGTCVRFDKSKCRQFFFTKMIANHTFVLLVCTCNSAVRDEKELMDDKRIEELEQKQEEVEVNWLWVGTRWCLHLKCCV